MRVPGNCYDVSTWDHESASWESRESGIDRRRLAALLDELRGEGWDRVSVLVIRRD